MMRKSIGKFESFDIARGIDVLDLSGKIEKVRKHLDTIEEVSYFKDSYIIKLKVKDYD